MTRNVTLTDEAGVPQGMMEIVKAHTGAGSLHKAFSVYVFTPGKTSILIQRRSAKKMLWPMIWANTCCSHPFEKETPSQAGERRLKEEFGMTCTLKPYADFVYRAEDPHGRGVEHEHVTILIGEVAQDAPPKPDPDEIAEWKWIAVDALQKDMKADPDAYAPWFHMGLDHILNRRHD